jgi:hypothetical protein
MVSETVIGYGPLSMTAAMEQAMLATVREELEPFFTFGDPTPGALVIGSFEVHLEPAPRFDTINEAPGVAIQVDTSLYKHLASSGRRWKDGDEIVIRIDATGSLFRFDLQSSQVDLWQSDERLASLDAVRTIKSVFTAALERENCVQLHSSGVVDSEGGTLILGDMWQGKTTLLLEMLSGFDVRQMSCDTVVAWRLPDGGIAARGWPSPFSMSLGTMSDHAQLKVEFPPEARKTPYPVRWSERRKCVLTSKALVELFDTSIQPETSHVHTIILARFSPQEETRLEPLVSEEKLRAILGKVYLGGRDPIYHNWHGFISSSDAHIEEVIERFAEAAFESVKLYEMVWAPSATSLIKRIDRFARLHKQMRDIVDY